MKRPTSNSRPNITPRSWVDAVAKEKDTAYLASTVDHHSVVLRRGSQGEVRADRFPDRADADLDAFEKQVAGHGIKTQRKKDPEPSISDMVAFADPKGTIMEVFKRDAFSHQKFHAKGIVPHKLGHVAFHVTDVKQVTKFYCDVLGFRESDWMGDFFSFLRCGPDHHTINLMETGSNRHFHTAFELRDWGHMQTRAISSASTATSCCGDRAGTASATICSPITAGPRSDHRDLRRTGPHERGTRLFRAAAMASRQSAEAESVGQGYRLGLQSLGHHAAATR